MPQQERNNYVNLQNKKMANVDSNFYFIFYFYYKLLFEVFRRFKWYVKLCYNKCDALEFS